MHQRLTNRKIYSEITVCSTSVVHRHIIQIFYRCFLPDLTGFKNESLRWIEVSIPLFISNKLRYCRSMVFNPAIAGCRLQGTATSPSSTTNIKFSIYCGADGDRTHDLSIANAALSQLSYGPIVFKITNYN